jgi:hypothetical protein
MFNMRYALKSNFELFIIYAAKYTKKCPEWHDKSHEDMVTFIMKESKGAMNPYVLRDKVIELYRSVGCRIGDIENDKV